MLELEAFTADAPAPSGIASRSPPRRRNLVTDSDEDTETVARRQLYQTLFGEDDEGFCGTEAPAAAPEAADDSDSDFNIPASARVPAPSSSENTCSTGVSVSTASTVKAGTPVVARGTGGS
eukprot:5859547-Pleurochrysis_carterae.AAC.2